MTENQNELKPLRECPFCGSFELELNAIPSVAQFIQCKKCKAKGPYWHAGSSARDIWNTRATSPAERQIEAIRAAMENCKTNINVWGGDSGGLIKESLFVEIEKILEEGK